MDYKSTILDIFSPRKNHFAVPNYQRAYSWEVGDDEDKHVPQFLTDLKEHPTSVVQYHLGHFLFEKDSVGNNKFWIIDGQQRMTTTIMLMSSIYKRLLKEPGYEKVADNLYSEFLISTDEQQKFQTVEYDNNYFLNIIIENQPDTTDTKSRRRILEAAKYFDKEISKVNIEMVLHWKSLIENAKITTDTVEDKAEATQIFTFQNDRGKDLTNLEKLKAFLMLQVYLSCKTSGTDPNASISYIEKEFETIYKSLEKIELIDENQILSYHTTAFLAMSGTAIERIKNSFLKQEETNKRKWIKDFVVRLKHSFLYTIAIQDMRNTYSHVPDVLYLDTPNVFPLLLKLFHFHNSLGNEIEGIIRLAEIILFRWKYTTGNYYSNYLPNLALEYRGNVNDLRIKLINYAKNGFKEYWNFEDDFIRYLEGNNHYFGLTRYLLWKYENHLRKEVKEPPMLYPEFSNLYGSPKFENTIDHWTPQNPYNLEYEQEFNEKYLHNIGNMVLSTRSRNASDSNGLPNNRSTFSTLISRQKLEAFRENWGKEQIQQRQQQIVEFAKQYWNPEIVI